MADDLYCTTIRIELLPQFTGDRRLPTPFTGVHYRRRTSGLPLRHTTLPPHFVSLSFYTLIPSPIEDDRFLRTKRCTQEGVRAGAKASVVACVASSIPTLVAIRKIPWAKANLNYTTQALIVSAGMPVGAQLSHGQGKPTNALYEMGER